MVLPVRVLQMSKAYLLAFFAFEWIPLIRNKAEITLSSKNHLRYCITSIDDMEKTLFLY